MDTKTIITTLDAGLLDAPAAVKLLCSAVDQQGALMLEMRRSLTAAIDTMTEIDKLLATRISTKGTHPILVGDPLRDLIQLVVAAMGDQATCERTPEEDVRAECERLANEEAGRQARAAFPRG